MNFNIIRTTRSKQKLSLAELSIRSGVSINAIRNLEKWNVASSSSTLYKILDELGLALRWKPFSTGVNLGSHIRQQRTSIGLSQRGLAKQIGISHPTMFKIENGADCKLGTLQRLDKALNLKLSIKPQEYNPNDWLSPVWLMNRLEKIFPDGFCLDPSSPASNQSTAVKALRYISISENGLLKSWNGFKTVYCNPPYDDIENWINKGWQELATTTDRDKMILMVIPAFVDYGYWHDVIFPHSRGIIFFRGRITFHNPDKSRRHQCHATALVIFATDTEWCKGKIEMLKQGFADSTFV
jgi:phage N-6-adenine-methyltransferase